MRPRPSQSRLEVRMFVRVSAWLMMTGVMLATAACAATPPRHYTSSPVGAGFGARSLIGAEEIAQSAGTTAFDLITARRPEFLNGLRTRGTAAPVVVFIDGVWIGGVEVLRTLPLSDIAEVRHLGATDAAMRFGERHAAGAILITTRERRTLASPPTGN